MKKNNTIEKKISFSELKKWNDCPYKHKISYIDKVPGFIGNEHTAFGTAIHYVCERKIVDDKNSLSSISLFLEKFKENITLLQKEGVELNDKLVSEMKEQGINLSNNIIPELKKHFHSFEIFSIEEEIMEPIEEFESYGKKFNLANTIYGKLWKGDKGLNTLKYFTGGEKSKDFFGSTKDLATSTVTPTKAGAVSGIFGVTSKLTSKVASWLANKLN